MYKILNAVRKQRYMSNTSGRHEKQIESILKTNGYERITIEKLNFEKKFIKETKYDKSDNTMWYVSQPCGSQSFPDFIVGDKFGNVFYVECKSSKKDHIVWNSGMPKNKGIYIFSSAKHDKQTIVMGSDLWDKEEMELQLKIRKLIEETYRPLKNNDHKVEYYGRHMHLDKSPVYGHETRTKRESKVYRFVEDTRKCQNS
jgi:hypothetical protein|tara:strand:+ start:86 stop:685 length:600 start_codon:yes stop_codon:yes gene_type:complete